MVRILKSPQCYCEEVLPDSCAFCAQNIASINFVKKRYSKHVSFVIFSMTLAFYHCKYSAVIVEKNRTLPKE